MPNFVALIPFFNDAEILRLNTHLALRRVAPAHDMVDFYGTSDFIIGNAIEGPLLCPIDKGLLVFN